MNKVLVELVLDRDSFADPNYGTGITWEGHGDVREVPADKWALMKKHTDVWREAEELPPSGLNAATTKEQEPSEAPETVLIKAESGAIVDTDVAIAFGDMSDEQVKSFAAEEGLKVDGRLRGDNLKAAVTAAYEAKLAAA